MDTEELVESKQQLSSYLCNSSMFAYALKPAAPAAVGPLSYRVKRCEAR